MSGASGRIDQSARWCFLSSFTPKYRSRSAARPNARRPRSVRVMEDGLHTWVFEQGPESRGLSHRQRIDDCRVLACRELEQVDSIHEAVEARALGVQCKNGRVRDRREKRVDAVGRVEVEGRMRASHAPNLTGIHFTRG